MQTGQLNPLFHTFADYRLGTVNSNTVSLKFHLIRSYCEIFFYHFPYISCLKCTVNSNFHLIRSKILLTNDFELTVPNLYINRVSARRNTDWLLSNPVLSPIGSHSQHRCVSGIKVEKFSLRSKSFELLNGRLLFVVDQGEQRKINP